MEQKIRIKISGTEDQAKISGAEDPDQNIRRRRLGSRYQEQNIRIKISGAEDWDQDIRSRR